MLAHESHQGHQSHLCIDVDRRQPEIDENERPEQCHRNRHQDHDRIAEAFVLRRKCEEHDDDREQKRHDEATGLLHVLARAAGVVDGVAGGRHFGDRCAHEVEHLLLRHRR